MRLVRNEGMKLAVRKIVEEVLEAEVTEALGRDYYENGAATGAGYRNGSRRGRLRTAEGPIECGVRQRTSSGGWAPATGATRSWVRGTTPSWWKRCAWSVQRD